MTAQRAAIDTAKVGVLRHLAGFGPAASKGELMTALGLRDDGYVWDEYSGLPHSRVLDRALQELRKAVRIKFDFRRWWLAEEAQQ